MKKVKRLGNKILEALLMMMFFVIPSLCGTSLILDFLGYSDNTIGLVVLVVVINNIILSQLVYWGYINE